MSEFVGHEPCPNCGSRDNLARFSDGHAWCFGCKHYEPATLLAQLQQEVNNNNKKDDRTLDLPVDFSLSIPPVGYEWLTKYELTPREIRQREIGWSNEGVYLQKKGIQLCPLLIFPFYDEDKRLLAWQGRYFGSDPAGTKYYTKGQRDSFLPICNFDGGDTLVVCEDCVSAFKLARITASMPLLGSHLNKEKALRISKLYRNLIIWLDYDKAKESTQMSMEYQVFFQGFTKSVITERDPKEYTTEELRKCL